MILNTYFFRKWYFKSFNFAMRHYIIWNIMALPSKSTKLFWGLSLACLLDGVIGYTLTCLLPPHLGRGCKRALWCQTRRAWISPWPVRTDRCGIRGQPCRSHMCCPAPQCPPTCCISAFRQKKHKNGRIHYKEQQPFVVAVKQYSCRKTRQKHHGTF